MSSHNAPCEFNSLVSTCVNSTSLVLSSYDRGTANVKNEELLMNISGHLMPHATLTVETYLVRVTLLHLVWVVFGM